MMKVIPEMRSVR